MKDKKTARQQQTKMIKGDGIESRHLRVLPYDRNGGFKECFPQKQTRLRGREAGAKGDEHDGTLALESRQRWCNVDAAR
jgi:hypothetical protein